MAKQKATSSRRANHASRGVLTVRRSDSMMKCNAEIGRFAQPSVFGGQLNENILKICFQKLGFFL